MPKKIVITGACGHIGSLLIRALPEVYPELQLILIDNMRAQRYCSLFDYKHPYAFIQEDFRQINLDELLSNADVLIHLAAITDAASSFTMAEEVFDINYHGTKKLADACSRTDTKLIFPSTTSVYGSQKKQIDETCSSQELLPQSPYAESKLQAETYIAELGRSQNLEYIIFRLGTISGISPGMRFHTALTKFCWQAAMAQPLSIWKTALNQKRPYLSLVDCIGSILWVIDNKIFDKSVYNVVTRNLSLHQIVDEIKKYIPDTAINFVEHQVMNQLSYEVLVDKFISTGFVFQGNIFQDISDTLNKIGKKEITPCTAEKSLKR